MATSVSYLIELRDRFARQAQRINASAERMRETMGRVGRRVGEFTGELIRNVPALARVGRRVNEFTGSLSRTRPAVSSTSASVGALNRNLNVQSGLMDRANNGLNSMRNRSLSAASAMRTLAAQARSANTSVRDFGAGMARKITLPMTVMGTVALVQSAKLETLATSFETMLGSAQKGQAMLEKLTDFTARTPFKLQEVGPSAKQLLAFGVSAENILPRLRMLGDLAAGTNTPLSNMAQVFGKVKAKGKAMTEELLQFSEAGIPIIQLLADKYGKTKEEILKLGEKGAITFSVLRDGLQDLTSGSGIFAGQMEKQSATLGGLFSTVTDNFLLTSAAIGDVMVDVFGIKGGMDGLIVSMGNMRKSIIAFAKEHPTITRMIAVFAAILAIMGPLIVAIGAMVIAYAVLAASAATAGVSIAALIWPVTLAVAAFVALVAIGVAVATNWDMITAKAKEMWGSVKQAFNDMVTGAKFMGNRMLDFLLAPFKAVIDFVSNNSLIQSIFGGGNSSVGVDFNAGNMPTFNAAQSMTQRSQTDVNVNLRAPANTIESIKSKTSGRVSGMNVGTNMREAI